MTAHIDGSLHPAAALPDGSFFFNEEGWTVQRDIKGRGWKVTRIDGTDHG